MWPYKKCSLPLQTHDGKKKDVILFLKFYGKWSCGLSSALCTKLLRQNVGAILVHIDAFRSHLLLVKANFQFSDATKVSIFPPFHWLLAYNDTEKKIHSGNADLFHFAGSVLIVTKKNIVRKIFHVLLCRNGKIYFPSGMWKPIYFLC